MIDRHPRLPAAIIASACSGHGFKHSAAVGEALAQLVLDGIEPPRPVGLRPRAVLGTILVATDAVAPALPLWAAPPITTRERENDATSTHIGSHLGLGLAARGLQGQAALALEPVAEGADVAPPCRPQADPAPSPCKTLATCDKKNGKCEVDASRSRRARRRASSLDHDVLGIVDGLTRRRDPLDHRHDRLRVRGGRRSSSRATRWQKEFDRPKAATRTSTGGATATTPVARRSASYAYSVTIVKKRRLALRDQGPDHRQRRLLGRAAAASQARASAIAAP